MAANPRFEVNSCNPDAVSFVSGFTTTHRSHVTRSPSLERGGSFRENHESRLLIHAGGVTNYSGNSNSGHGELLPLSQVLLLDILPSWEQKYARQLELRRAVKAAVDANMEDTLHGSLQAKPLDHCGPDEVKRIKASIFDNLHRARERSRLMVEAISKLERYRSMMQSRKRARPEPPVQERPIPPLSVERPATNGNSLKNTIGASSNIDAVTPKLEDKNKVAVPNKRVRTSMADVRPEGRPNNSGFQKASGFADREQDPVKLSSSLGGEDRDRLGSTGSEGCEKIKMKGKRSGSKQDANVATATNGSSEAEREQKWGGHQRIHTDGRSKPSENHGFRSGPLYGVVSIPKVQSATQQNGLAMRSVSKNEYDFSPSLSEKGDRLGGMEKERALLKNGVKPLPREESHLLSPKTTTKAKVARAPRSSSAAPVNPSAHATRGPSPSDVWDRPAPNKVQLPVGAMNRKRPTPTRSSSPPVAQWVGQRPPKMARVARRTNLVPPVVPTSIREEATSIGEGISPRDGNMTTGARSNSSISTGSGFARKVSVAATLSQSKFKNERTTLSTGLSESDDSEGGDSKSKEKVKKCGDSEGKFAVVKQRMGPLILTAKKSRVVLKEEGGDGVRRQGRSGRSLVVVRGSATVTPVEKVDVAANAKQPGSVRPGFDKPDRSLDIKLGRPPTKKGAVDRKPLTRPRRPVGNEAGGLSGESDDDHEELAAAVRAAVNASAAACPSDFWKQMDPYFAFLTHQDLEYLRQKVRELVDRELDAVIPFCKEESEKIDASKMISPAESLAGKPACLANGGIEVDSAMVSKGFSNFKDKQDPGRNERKGTSGGWLEKMLPLSQRLLAALIREDDSDYGSREFGSQDRPSDFTKDESPFGFCHSEHAEYELELEVEVKNRAEHRKWNGDLKGSSHDHICISNGHTHHNIATDMLNDDLGDGDGSLVHPENNKYTDAVKPAVGKDDDKFISTGAKSKDDQILVHQSICAVSGQISWDVQYQEMNLDDRIILELQSIGLFPEPVPDLQQREDDEVGDELRKSQLELKERVCSNKDRIQALERAVLTRRETEERERECLAMSKLFEIAYNRRLGCRGGLLASGSKGSAAKSARTTTLSFAKRTLARLRNFVETGQSCFRNASSRDILFCVSLKEGKAKASDSIYETGGSFAAKFAAGLTTLGPSESKFAAASSVSDGAGRLLCLSSGIEKADKEPSESDQVTSVSLEPIECKDDIWLSHTKKREFIEGVVASSTWIENTVLGGTKGKRSERERDVKGQSKDNLGKNDCNKGGKQGLGSVKGERKTKTKPRQKTAPLLKAGTGLLGKRTELAKENATSVPIPLEKSIDKFMKAKDEPLLPLLSVQEAPLEMEGPIDLSHLQLPGMEDLVVTDDLAGQGQDLGSWLVDFEDSGLQDVAGDHLIGLAVPMDDLSELAMMM